MKLLRNLGGALSLALLVGLVVSSVPLGAQTVTAFTAERSLSLSNILTTVTPTASPAFLAALAAGAIEIREQSTLNPVAGTLSSTFFYVPTGSPNPTVLSQVPFGAFIASTTLTIDRTYVNTNPVSVGFHGRVTQSTATPFGNYAGGSGSYSFGYTSDKPPKINNVIEVVDGLIVLYSPAATGTFTITAPTSGGGGGTGGVSVVINGGSGTTFTTVVNQIVLDASGSTTTTGGTLTYAWALAAGSPSASITGGNTAKAAIQLNSGQNSYKFTLTITDSMGTTPTVVAVTVNFI